MSIKIREIISAGKIEDERLVIDVLADCDIGRYFTCNSRYTNDRGSVSSKVCDPFWFPDKAVKKGDLVILYSKKGNQSEKNNASGTISYFFYRNSASTLWNDDTDCAIVLEIAKWMSKGKK